MADRGLSTIVNYVLILGILAILTTTLVGGFGPFVTHQQASVGRATLTVFGNDLASAIGSADRLVIAAGPTGSVELGLRLPDRVGGSPYRISVARAPPGPSDYVVTLRAVDVEAVAIVHVRTSTPLTERTGSASLRGGTLTIRFDRNGGNLVVSNA